MGAWLREIPIAKATISQQCGTAGNNNHCKWSNEINDFEETCFVLMF